MDTRHSNLVQLVEYQKKEIEKYKTKLRDLVAAHRGLLKEKEALENSLKALNASNNINQPDAPKTDEENEGETVPELKNQLSSLLNSLATLSAEKSRMEASFQLDKKQLHEEKETINKKNKELQDQVTLLQQEIEEIKSKLILERHERDREQNDHGVMIKELQRLLANERSSKQQLEATLEESKQRVLSSDTLAPQLEKYERKIAILKNELESTRQKLETYEKKAKEMPVELIKLQDEMRNLQMEHQIQIQYEKERARDVEERSKKLSLIQEERVVNLETRLAELSEIVGTYDRLRQQDQAEIHKLKEHIALIDLEHVNINPQSENQKENKTLDDIVKKILDLKKELKEVCEKSGKFLDFYSLFTENYNENLHAICNEEYNKLKKEFEIYKSDAKAYSQSSNQEKSVKEVVGLQNQIKNLQERVRILSDKNRDAEKEYQLQIEQLKKTIKNEKSRFKETLAASEADYRGRLSLLEQQLQKQRERSLALLEEKEQELHSLQSTFQMFLPGCRKSPEEESNSLLGSQIRDGPHMLHYANELARRDVEIANLRKTKHKTEIALRELQKAAVSDAEKHRDERQALREEIARLKRCQTREGANLEYLKNVVLSFLLSNDPNSKRHMCTAIAAVLKFSEAELDKVTQHSKNSWWGSVAPFAVGQMGNFPALRRS